MLLAAGGFATTATAATIYTDSYGDGLAATADGQDIAIGTDLLGHDYDVAQYHWGLKGSSDIPIGNGVPTAALGVLGNSEMAPISYTAPGLPDPSEAFYNTIVNPITKQTVPVATLLDGTTISGDDAYLHLRFDIDGDTYLGTAHFDMSSHTVDGATLKDISYTAAPAPEPATWAEMIGGLGAIGGALRAARRRKTQLASA